MPAPAGAPMGEMADGAVGPAGAPIVSLAQNPTPEGAAAFWCSAKAGRVRMLVAPAPPGRPARGSVFVCPGRTEVIEKYFETVRELQARGFAVAVLDWPGQGLSERMHKSPLAGHVRSYSLYVDALVRGAAAIADRMPRPYVLLGHSMGAAIALQALRQRKFEAAAAAFSAPMWGLRAWFFQRWFARLVRLFGGGALIARPPGPEETFATNQLTHDERRWRLHRELVEAEPRLALGEPTVGWVVASLNVCQGFFETGALDALRRLPVLVALASEETIVKLSAQRALARRFKAGRTVTIEGAGHEILMETDPRRAVFWTAFDELLSRAGL